MGTCTESIISWGFFIPSDKTEAFLRAIIQANKAERGTDATDDDDDDDSDDDVEYPNKVAKLSPSSESDPPKPVESDAHAARKEPIDLEEAQEEMGAFMEPFSKHFTAEICGGEDEMDEDDVSKMKIVFLYKGMYDERSEGPKDGFTLETWGTGMFSEPVPELNKDKIVGNMGENIKALHKALPLKELGIEVKEQWLHSLRSV